MPEAFTISSYTVADSIAYVDDSDWKEISVNIGRGRLLLLWMKTTVVTLNKKVAAVQAIFQMCILSVWLAQLVKGLAALTHVRSCVQVSIPEAASTPPG